MPKFAIDQDSCPTYEATDLFERMEEAVRDGDYEEMRLARWELRRLGWIVDRQPSGEEVEADRRPDDPNSFTLLRLWDVVDVQKASENALRNLLRHPHFPSPAAIDEIGPLFDSFEFELFREVVRKRRRSR